MDYPEAPELAVSRWFNTDENPTLAGLRGEVVVIEAFPDAMPGMCFARDPAGSADPAHVRRCRQRARTSLCVRAPRGYDAGLTRSLPVRVPHHVPGRCRRLRHRCFNCRSRWAGTSCVAPRASSPSTEPGTSVFTPSAKSTTLQSVPPLLA